MCRILLVDDEPRVLRSLSAALELDHEIVATASGEEAMSLASQSGPFDAIISDELMPGTKGHELLNWCRENTPQSKLVLLTGLPVTPELKQEFHSESEVSFLSKPWNINELEHVLATAKSTSHPAKDELTKTATADEAQPILVMESSRRYREFYTEFAAKNGADVVFFDKAADLLKNTSPHQTAHKLVLDIGNDHKLGLVTIEAVQNQFPQAWVLVTASPAFIRHYPDIQSRFERLTVLAKPFFYDRLAGHLGNTSYQM